jgi:uncharacterized membrane protein YeaQ/YmgE (transglycosylase-associated protein family)
MFQTLFAIVGIIAGLIAARIQKADGFQLAGYVVFGAIGGLVAGIVFRLITYLTYRLFGVIIVLGVVILVLVLVGNYFKKKE